MSEASDTGILRAVKDCDRMEIKCFGKDGANLTLYFRSSGKGVKGLFKDIAYALEDFRERLK